MRPEATRGAKKYAGYDGAGMYNWESFARFPGLSRESRYELIRASNNSLTRATWSSYQTAARHLTRCRQRTGQRMTMPLSEEDVLRFILYLRKDRGLQASTIENYISAMKRWVSS